MCACNALFLICQDYSQLPQCIGPPWLTDYTIGLSSAKCKFWGLNDTAMTCEKAELCSGLLNTFQRLYDNNNISSITMLWRQHSRFGEKTHWAVLNDVLQLSQYPLIKICRHTLSKHSWEHKADIQHTFSEFHQIPGRTIGHLISQFQTFCDVVNTYLIESENDKWLRPGVCHKLRHHATFWPQKPDLCDPMLRD